MGPWLSPGECRLFKNLCDGLSCNQKQMMEKDIMHAQKRDSPEGGALDYVTRPQSRGKYRGLIGKVHAVYPGMGTTSGGSRDDFSWPI